MMALPSLSASVIAAAVRGGGRTEAGREERTVLCNGSGGGSGVEAGAATPGGAASTDGTHDCGVDTVVFGLLFFVGVGGVG